MKIMKKIVFILFSLIFSTVSVQARRAMVKAGKQLTHPTTVTYPISCSGYVSIYRHPYTYPYAGVAFRSYNSLNTYNSEPVGVSVWPKVFIGAGVLFLVYLVYSGFDEKNQTPHSRNAKQDICYPNLVHTHSVELANGGILVR